MASTSTFLRSSKQAIRIVSGGCYLLFMLISIPISFRVGGLTCGLAFTVTLFNLYLVSTTLTIFARKHGHYLFRVSTSFLYYSQHFIIASLLYMFLSWFPNTTQDGVNWTWHTRSGDNAIQRLSNVLSPSDNAFFQSYSKYVIQPWQYMLSQSTPFFALSEGLFTILAIQAIGETNKWLSYEVNSNTWIITSLVTSAGVITASLYFLYRVYVTPIWEITVQTATLLGFTLSVVFGVGIYGIITQAGSVIESSLFFAYIVRCIYEISPKLATTATDEMLNVFKEVWQNRQGTIPISNNLLTYYHNVILANAKSVWEPFFSAISDKGISKWNLASWRFLQPMWRFFKNFTFSIPFSINELFTIFFKMTADSVSPAIVINLCFRVLVFYSATRIIPALQRRNHVSLGKGRKVMQMLYWYSPCILIAMYSHLILQYSGELQTSVCVWGCNGKWFDPNQPKIEIPSWVFWNWCNIFWTILIYANELRGGVNSNSSK